MFDGDFLAAPFEVKFASSGEPGTFEGYGSVFGNIDSHGDVVMPGAFSQTLAERKAQGRTIAMHVMHGLFGGDGLPAGVWTDASEDSKGLHLKGKLSGMDTDYGKRLHGLVKDGALGGLSIGFSVPQGGAVKAAQGSGASRQINRVNLHEVSLVDDPSNAASRVTDMKRRFERWRLKTAMTPDKATASIAAAIGLHQASLKGGHPPTQEECDAMLQHLQEAHEALTGAALPITRKSSYAEDFRHVLETLSGLGRPSSFLAGFSLPDLKGMSMGGSGKTPFGDLMSSAMKEMNADMSKAKMTGNPDHDFAAMMVPHHVGAVAMAQAELDHGKDPAMRALATSVISGQDAQIKTMRDWLKAHIS